MYSSVRLELGSAFIRVAQDFNMKRANRHVVITFYFRGRFIDSSILAAV